MKRIIALILLISTLFACIPASADTILAENRQYELWTQSPTVTSGLTEDEIRVYKGLDMGNLQLYPMPDLGSQYYLGMVDAKVSDGGYSGKTKLCDFYYYIILLTDDRIVVTSRTESYNGYYWDRGHSMSDIRSDIDGDYYHSKGYEKPLYIFNPNGKYTNSNYNEYDEYFIVTDAGTLYTIREDADYGCERVPYIHNGKFYLMSTSYRRSSSNYYYYLSDGSTQAALVEEIGFSNGSFSTISSTKIAKTDITEANGYVCYDEGFDSNMKEPSYYKIDYSDNLFFTYSVSRGTYNSTEGAYPYTFSFQIYQSDGDKMIPYKTVTKVKYLSSFALSTTPSKITNQDIAYYNSNGKGIPVYALSEFVIMSTGNIYDLELNRTKYKYWYYSMYNGRLAVSRAKDGETTFYHQISSENTSKAYFAKVEKINFYPTNALLMNEEEYRVYYPPTGLNGYFTSYSNFNECTDLKTASYAKTSEWWTHNLTNVFPDGRYVICDWTGIGNSCYEIWYNIYSPTGQRIASGPTGYSGAFSDVFDTYDLVSYAINDTKFIVTFNNIGKRFMKEYFRIATAYETDSGDVVSGGSMGEKNISTMAEADTEPVQSVIDFGQNDLPIGYNIKDGIIDADKLDTDLKEQVNGVCLNDIVIIKKSGTVTGNQNTGTALTSTTKYIYDCGDSYIKFNTNGTKVNWYCYNPEKLDEGKYNLAVVMGDKTIYVKVIVIVPPNNDGTTTVVF